MASHYCPYAVIVLNISNEPFVFIKYLQSAETFYFMTAKKITVVQCYRNFSK